jgi:hypothetical protein
MHSQDYEDGDGEIMSMAITNKHSGTGVYLGAQLITLHDQEDIARHFIESINSCSPAARMFLEYVSVMSRVIEVWVWLVTM